MSKFVYQSGFPYQSDWNAVTWPTFMWNNKEESKPVLVDTAMDNKKLLETISKLMEVQDTLSISNAFWESEIAQALSKDVETIYSNATRTISLEDSKMNTKTKVKSDMVELPEVEDFRDFVKEMSVEITREKTFVTLVVINKKDNKANKPSSISTKFGHPLGGYVYDRETNSYYLECVEQAEIGYVNCSLFISLPNIGHWKLPVPIPVSVLSRYLSYNQNKIVKLFKDKYNQETYELQFVQIRGNG